MCTFREAVGMERWGKVAECGCVKGGEWGGAVVEEEEWEEMVLSESLRVVSSESNLLLCVCVCVCVCACNGGREGSRNRKKRWKEYSEYTQCRALSLLNQFSGYEM